MNEVTRVETGRDVAEFKPDGAGDRIYTIEQAINVCQRIKDWDSLHTAVNEIVKLIENTVGWWDINVRDDGRPKNSPSPGTVSYTAPEAEQKLGVRKQKISKWKPRIANKEQFKKELYGASYHKAMAEASNSKTVYTGENEWYTPDIYLNAVREFYGGTIDLDAASSDFAQAKVRAEQYFTAEQDALTKPWHGRVWLNPPYSQPEIGHFVAKLVSEVFSGNVTEAVLLTHNYTDTAWFHEAVSAASAICFTRGRIKFYNSAGTEAAPTQGQAFSYFGDRVNEFHACFSEFGFITGIIR